MSLYFIHNSTKTSCKKLILFRVCHVSQKLIPGVLRCSVNFKMRKRFLCRWSVFPDNLSVSCDYGLRKNVEDLKELYMTLNLKFSMILIN